LRGLPPHLIRSPFPPMITPYLPLIFLGLSPYLIRFRGLPGYLTSDIITPFPIICSKSSSAYYRIWFFYPDL
jgi:hypothetical protein